jgi:16S rRNA (cytosine967-C5)-methyltransferase
MLQDLASILVGEVAAPSPRDTVLDLCAAPGAKTSHLAQLMHNQGSITSIDIDARRLAAWSRLMKRMGVANAKPVQLDASMPYALPEEADLVVLDPPCSGTGTFNAYPSSKWRLTQNMILEYASLQRRLLENAASHVKEGGSLVYSTCSVTLEENEGIIEPFLENYSEFRLVESAPRIGSPGMRGLREAQRLYPCLHKSEGFFIARLVKG